MKNTIKECKECQQRLVREWFEDDKDICQFCEPITITIVK